MTSNYLVWYGGLYGDLETIPIFVFSIPSDQDALGQIKKYMMNEMSIDKLRYVDHKKEDNYQFDETFFEDMNELGYKGHVSQKFVNNLFEQGVMCVDKIQTFTQTSMDAQIYIKRKLINSEFSFDVYQTNNEEILREAGLNIQNPNIFCEFVHL